MLSPELKVLSLADCDLGWPAHWDVMESRTDRQGQCDQSVSQSVLSPLSSPTSHLQHHNVWTTGRGKYQGGIHFIRLGRRRDSVHTFLHLFWSQVPFSEGHKKHISLSDRSQRREVHWGRERSPTKRTSCHLRLQTKLVWRKLIESAPPSRPAGTRSQRSSTATPVLRIKLSAPWRSPEKHSILPSFTR